MIGGSPRPFEPRFVRCSSGSSTSSLTISGTSAIVGSLYASRLVVRIWPVRGSCSRCSESVWPIPWMIPPPIWLDAPSGLITRPTSWIAATRSTQISPVSTSTATSATCTPNVSTAVRADADPGNAGRAAAAIPDLRGHADTALHGVGRPCAHLVAPLPVRLGAAVALEQVLARIGPRVLRVVVGVVQPPQLEG